ncbi:hypothetical protein GCM10023322_84010 [Rugosimonospora acidiphila]|uniref:Exo-alpha-sialidase n=1 Tax=Rugosimonospora acidiphila TaxID=556531 RepID=A0ABP9ST20_9ACTN
MPDFDFSGLRSTSQAAFKTDFVDVAHRSLRRRRRRQLRLAGTALAVAAVATGVGVKGVAGQSSEGLAGGMPGVKSIVTPPFIPPGQPSHSPAGGSGHDIRMGAVQAGDLNHLYVNYNDCRKADCTVMFAATADAGTDWTRSPLPVPHDALVELFVVAPRTVLAWYQTSGAQATQRWLSTSDGGQNWRQGNVSTVAALPASWQILGQDFEGASGVAVLAANPVTGDLAQLAPRQLPGGRALGGLPASAGLWLTGASLASSDPRSTDGAVTFTGSVIEVSHDGGRAWQQYTLPETISGGDQDPGAVIATADGHTAYAVGQAHGMLQIYRTADGGKTWQRAAGQVRIGSDPRRLYAALRPDGTLTIQVGDQAADHPRMYQSTDQGRTLKAVTVGPGAAAVAVPGGYAQSGWPNQSGSWLSGNGTDWTYAAPPA